MTEQFIKPINIFFLFTRQLEPLSRFGEASFHFLYSAFLLLLFVLHNSSHPIHRLVIPDFAVSVFVFVIFAHVVRARRTIKRYLVARRANWSRDFRSYWWFLLEWAVLCASKSVGAVVASSYVHFSWTVVDFRFESEVFEVVFVCYAFLIRKKSTSL